MPKRPPPSMEVSHRYDAELVALLRGAQRDGVEIAGWLSAGLCEVARELPGKSEELLEQRPYSWEADLVRKLCSLVSL